MSPMSSQHHTSFKVALSLTLVLGAVCIGLILRGHPTTTTPEVVPSVMSIRRCNDIMEARRLMTDTQLRARWPGGDSSPVQWEVRVIDILRHPQGPGAGLQVHFACPDSGKLAMAGTFYTTARALPRGGLDINRGDIITVRGHLHRNIEGWGASLSELEILSYPWPPTPPRSPDLPRELVP